MVPDVRFSLAEMPYFEFSDDFGHTRIVLENLSSDRSKNTNNTSNYYRYVHLSYGVPEFLLNDQHLDFVNKFNLILLCLKNKMIREKKLCVY